MQPNKLTIVEAIKKLDDKEISSVELTESCINRIKEVDGKIKACLTVCEESALNEAKKADQRRAAGESGDLLGIPYLSKDNIMTVGVRTTAASKILENYIAPYDATIIKRLKEAGAVLLGKTNLDEFAHGASTENSAFGASHNPWDLDRVPGGSSGGSAAAVAADMCLFALGTDTGGSIRCPASFCGITGLKPTYGRNSRFGLIAMTSSTDVPGPMTKTVEDACLVESVLAGYDNRDATTVEIEVADYQQELAGSISGLRVGLPEEYFSAGLDFAIKQAIDQAVEGLRKRGVIFSEVSLPHTKYGIPVYYIITPSEVSSNLARFDGIKYGLSVDEDKRLKTDLINIYTQSRGQGFGPEAKRRIMLGAYVLSAGYFDAYYLQAQKVRTIIKNEFDSALSKVDCLLTPTQPRPAFKIGEKTSDPLAMYLEDIFIVGASLAGLPALSVPCGFVDGMPIGLQLIGRRFDEATILRLGNHYQSINNWQFKKPNL